MAEDFQPHITLNIGSTAQDPEPLSTQVQRLNPPVSEFEHLKQEAGVTSGGIMRWGAIRAYNLMANIGVEQDEKLDPGQANEEFAPEGEKLFTEPVYRKVAGVIGKARAEELERNAIIDRYQNQHGTARNLVTGFVGFMLDPVNDATAIIPGVGEGATFARLAEAGLAPSLAKFGARAVGGATSGAMGMGGVAALKYGTGLEEHSDYGAAAAMSDIFNGALTGAVFHAAINPALGAARAKLTGNWDHWSYFPQADAILGADANSRRTLMQTHIAQMLDGRPGDSTALFPDFTPQVREAIPEHYARYDGLRSELDNINTRLMGTASPDAWEAANPELLANRRPELQAAVDAAIKRIAPEHIRNQLEESIQAARSTADQRYAMRRGGGEGYGDQTSRNAGGDQARAGAAGQAAGGPSKAEMVGGAPARTPWHNGPASTDRFGIEGYPGSFRELKPVEEDNGNISHVRKYFLHDPTKTVVDEHGARVPKIIAEMEVKKLTDGRMSIYDVEAARGLGTRFYDAVAAHFGGAMRPSSFLTEAGYSFWKKRDPEAIKWHRWSDEKEGEGYYISPPEMLRRIEEQGGWYPHMKELYKSLPPEAKVPGATDQMFALRLHEQDRLEVLAKSDPEAGLIRIAVNAIDAEAKARGTTPEAEAVRVVRHEGLEHLLALGLIHPAEWRILENAARRYGWVESTGVRKAYSELYRGADVPAGERMSPADLEQLLLKEAIAEKYSTFHLDKGEVPEEVHGIFQRIKDFLTDLMNFVRGIKDHKDIFRDVDEGVMKERYEAPLRARQAEIMTELHELYPQIRDAYARLQAAHTPDLKALGEQQRQLYENGWAEGLSDAEHAEAKEEFYGKPDTGQVPGTEAPARVAAAARPEPGNNGHPQLDAELAAAEQHYAEAMNEHLLLPEEIKEVEDARIRLEAEQLKEGAMQQAADCLMEAGL